VARAGVVVADRSSDRVAIAATPARSPGHGVFGIFVQSRSRRHPARGRDEHLGSAGLDPRVIVLDRDPDACPLGPRRFSPVALTSVVVIVATGLFASWRQVGFSPRRLP